MALFHPYPNSLRILRQCHSFDRPSKGYTLSDYHGDSEDDALLWLRIAISEAEGLNEPFLSHDQQGRKSLLILDFGQ
jgi:hypothetical protein